MRRTLFLIPHEIGPLPVFGLGWALLLLAFALLLRLGWASRAQRTGRGADRPDSDETAQGAPSWGQVLANEGWFWALAAVLIIWVLPSVELRNAAGAPVGMAIRGYGVFLVLGVGSAVALAAYRAGRRGIHPDLIFAMAPWAFIGGIVGARLFYVIQYWDSFVGETAWETLRNALAFTEGGLVVYGAFMGGFLGALWFTLRHELPVLRLGDAIVPCLFLGVFFGRIGCLMNGCCYGGRCEDGWAALRFPPQSPVYQEQLSSGELLGMNIDPETGRIRSVQSGSVAAELGIESGQTYQGGRADFQPLETADPALPQEQVLPGWILRVSGQTHVLGPEKLPARSLPVRAAQLISSLTGLALCLTLCAASLVFRRPGAIMFGGFASYAVVRFGLEMVRVDEAGQFNTSLSISQWVSIFVFAISVAGLIWLYRRDQEPTEPAVPAATTPPSSGVESTG